jgi:acyl dehydratase
LAHPESGIDFSRVVHGDQKFEYSRPIVAGDELVATLSVTKVQSLGAHSMVTSESVMTTVAGEHVVTASSTLVVRGDA